MSSGPDAVRCVNLMQSLPYGNCFCNFPPPVFRSTRSQTHTRSTRSKVVVDRNRRRKLLTICTDIRHLQRSYSILYPLENPQNAGPRVWRRNPEGERTGCLHRVPLGESREPSVGPSSHRARHASKLMQRRRRFTSEVVAFAPRSGLCRKMGPDRADARSAHQMDKPQVSVQAIHV